MDLTVLMRDGTRYRAPVEALQAVLRFTAAQGSVQGAQELTVLTDSGEPTRRVRWLNAAEVVEISEVVVEVPNAGP